MKGRQPETSLQHLAQIQGDASDLHSLLLMCATGCEGEEASRVMNAAAVLTAIIRDRAAVVWNQLHDSATKLNAT